MHAISFVTVLRSCVDETNCNLHCIICAYVRLTVIAIAILSESDSVHDDNIWYSYGSWYKTYALYIADAV